MENELRSNVLFLSDCYRLVDPIGERVIGERALRNPRLIPALREGGTMTIRSYDRLISWFSTNWPETLAWPERIIRPQTVNQEKPVGK